MIKLMGANDLLEASILMSDTEFVDSYHGYYRNELVWSQRTINTIAGQLSGDPSYLAIKYVNKDGKMVAFMTASVYADGYTGESIMDVHDMIVDYKAGKKTNAKSVGACFDYMIEHVKKHGGKGWRADSIHSYEQSKGYAEFLQKKYGCAIRFSARGVIE